MSNMNFNASELLNTDKTRELSEEFSSLFGEIYGSTRLHSGDIIKGTVVSIDDHVVLSVGLKSYAYLPKQQFKDMHGELEVAIGEQVDVCLEAVENGYGETRVSREKAKYAEAWIKLEEAYKEGTTLTGVICDRVKGGFTVEISSVKTFLPGSQLDVRPMRNLNLEGNTIEVKVIKIDKKRNNVVVSRKALIELENSAEREKLLASLEEGQEIKGIVKNLTNYGAFIDLGGIDGLLHVTDISWKRIKYPNEVLKLDQEVLVKILKFDKEKQRVSLGIKQLDEDPWLSVIKRYPAGSRLQGKVTNLTDYGCFVEIEEGVEGLVHVSEMDWTNKNAHPSKIVQVGNLVDVEVLAIDKERRRISLGIKQCKENPWDDFLAKNKIGAKVKAPVRSITDFGIFVGLEGGIDGLIHLSDISWNQSNEKILQQYEKGDEIEAVILKIESDRERISLGIKQLSENPCETYMNAHEPGDVVDSTVETVKQRKLTVTLADGVIGILKSFELNRKKIKDATEIYQPDQPLKVKLMGFGQRNNVINVLFEDSKLQEKRIAKKDLSTVDIPVEQGSLGGLIKEQLVAGKHIEQECEDKDEVSDTHHGKDETDERDS